MPKLLLVRHAQTDWNRDKRYQGQTDTELNDTGRKQAARLGERLRDQKIDAVYTSDLKRVVETARIVTVGHDLEMISCPELREIDFGELEGMTLSEIQKIYPYWGGLASGVDVPAGEGLERFAARVAGFVPRLAEHDGADTVMVVAHGGSLKVLICHLLGIDAKYWWRLRLDSASLAVVDYSPEVVVLAKLNDTAHLDGD